MPQPDPDVARLIAEEVLRGGGEFRTSVGNLHALIRQRLPESPAAESPATTATAVLSARPDLGALGIAVRRSRNVSGRREWVFRLIAIAGEYPETRSQAA